MASTGLKMKSNLQTTQTSKNNNKQGLLALPLLAAAKDAYRKTKWVEQAYGKIAAAEKASSVEKIPLERNKLINKAYAEMYLSNPAIFKWAGMAAFASQSAGKKMAQIQLGYFAELTAQIVRPVLGLPLTLAAKNCEYLFGMVALGNKAIYEDLYWQHLAYREGGIEELEAIYREGDLPVGILTAWQQIDTGAKTDNQELIWAGNTSLLMHEQKYIIQPVLYAGKLNLALWKLISLVHSLSGLLLTSPVPGGALDFRDAVPGGNLANFADRWQWCIETILPVWRKLQTNDPAQVQGLLEVF